MGRYTKRHNHRMDKAVIGNRIFMKVPANVRENIDRELTYPIPPRNPLDPPFIIKNMALIAGGLISVPSGRTDLIPQEYEIVDKRVTKPIDFPEFAFTLRESQQKVYDEVEDCAIINAWVSWGKTFTGLALASKLKQKTLVVVHTIALRNQWAKEVEKVFGFTPGIIGSGKFETDSPIVIGNIQSLYRKIKEIQKEFGTVILDEMHHISSPTFSRIIDKMHSRYKIGLTGTLERKDGKHVVFRDYFGNHVIKPPKENFMTPVIDIIKSEVRFLDGNRIPWANRINHLVSQEEYLHSVAMIASAYATRGHKVLVVSDRVSLLKTCARLSGDSAVCITGELDQEERESLLESVKTSKDILYGTQAIFSEGISLNALSCLVLATPINNDPLLTQLIGRIVRKQEGKKQPIVVDIHLRGKTAAKQAKARYGFYMKQGYEIRIL
tara:strand:+ start:74 stop:1390 length:1317 start_codon:yes stop_codon:yes gene_type:complete